MLSRFYASKGALSRYAVRKTKPRHSFVSSSPQGRYLTRCFSASGGGGSHKDEVIIPGTRHEYGSLGERPLPSRPAVPWQAEHNIDVQRVTQKAIVYELTQESSNTLESVVPWFLENMPPSYFRQVPERFRNDHIKAIAAVKDANMDMYLNLKAHLADGRQVLTFIRPGTEPGTLLRMVESLPWQHNQEDYMPLTRILVFSTKDQSMSLNMFVYGVKEEGKPGRFDELQTGASILDYAQKVQNGEVAELEPSPLFERESMQSFLQVCSENYINAGSSDPRRFLRQRQLFDGVSGTEGVRINIEPAGFEEEADRQGNYWVDVAVANSLPQVALENVCRLLFLHKFDVTRSRLDVVSDGDNGSVTMLRMLVKTVHGENASEETFEILERELRRVKWLDPITMDLVFGKFPDLGVIRGEVITAFCSLMHRILASENAIAFSRANISDTVTNERFIPYARLIADLFLDRFDPKNPMVDTEFEAKCDEIRRAIDTDVEDTIAIELLLKMIDIVGHTLKTNVYMTDRYALGLRLDPNIMVGPSYKDRELPYGVVFVHGRRFNGFHVRFRDISRGGMRLVTPRSQEMYALESARQYDECYGLAFAQQLKNKDIPEGGSKAVNLINTIGLSESAKYFVMRKSVKAMTDTILDLIVQTDETKENIVDRWGKQEVLYLGPDEQVIPEDINWIIKRAAYRGYPTPAAFMSSKPRAGINHKEYGVTSEGVNVYLDVSKSSAILVLSPFRTPNTDGLITFRLHSVTRLESIRRRTASQSRLREGPMEMLLAMR